VNKVVPDRRDRAGRASGLVGAEPIGYRFEAQLPTGPCGDRLVGGARLGLRSCGPCLSALHIGHEHADRRHGGFVANVAVLKHPGCLGTRHSRYEHIGRRGTPNCLRELMAPSGSLSTAETNWLPRLVAAWVSIASKGEIMIYSVVVRFGLPAVTD